MKLRLKRRMRALWAVFTKDPAEVELKQEVELAKVRQLEESVERLLSEERRLAALGDEIKRLDAKKTSLLNEQTDLEEIVAHYRDHRTELEKDIAKLAESAFKQEKDLEKQLADLQTRKQKLMDLSPQEKKLAEIKAEIERRNIQWQNYDRLAETRKVHIQRLAKQITGYEKSLRDTNNQLEARKQELDHVAGEAKQLHAQVDYLFKQRGELQTEVNELSDKLRSLRDAIKRSEEEFRSCEDRLSAARIGRDEAENWLSSAWKQVGIAEEKHHEADLEIEKLEARRASLRSDIAELESQYAQVLSTIDAFVAAVKTSEDVEKHSAGENNGVRLVERVSKRPTYGTVPSPH